MDELIRCRHSFLPKSNDRMPLSLSLTESAFGVGKLRPGEAPEWNERIMPTCSNSLAADEVGAACGAPSLM